VLSFGSLVSLQRCSGVIGVAFEANPNQLFSEYFKIPRGVAVVQALGHDVFVLAPPWSNCSNYTASIDSMMKQLAEDPGVILKSPRLHIGTDDPLMRIVVERNSLPPSSLCCITCCVVTRLQSSPITQSGAPTYTSLGTKATGERGWITSEVLYTLRWIQHLPCETSRVLPNTNAVFLAAYKAH
jgi:hypothetical protein